MAKFFMILATSVALVAASPLPNIEGDTVRNAIGILRRGSGIGSELLNVIIGAAADTENGYNDDDEQGEFSAVSSSSSSGGFSRFGDLSRLGELSGFGNWGNAIAAAAAAITSRVRSHGGVDESSRTIITEKDDYDGSDGLVGSASSTSSATSTTSTSSASSSSSSTASSSSSSGSNGHMSSVIPYVPTYRYDGPEIVVEPRLGYGPRIGGPGLSYGPGVGRINYASPMAPVQYAAPYSVPTIQYVSAPSQVVEYLI